MHPHLMGDDDGPLAADHYKRAVFRPAPTRFAIEFLPPTRVGGSGNYSYGMRITPVSRGDRSSISSKGSNSEYDVWRRWEDCLWFQDALELEYKRSARQKRQRLLQGKGVKKNGFYMQDHASSWESLPPGPDPNSVSQDIHDYIPKLTKRGTIFRTSPATIEARGDELKAFVETLFKPDQPALIREMRSTRLVTDFFGIWHRDADLASKKQKEKAGECRDSVTPSIFSSYFSALSNPSLLDVPIRKASKSLPNSPTKLPFLRPRSSTTTEDSRSATMSQVTDSLGGIGENCDPFATPETSSLATVRRRALSATSSESSSSNSDEHSDNGAVPDEPRIVEEVPVVFGHNPLLHTQQTVQEHPGSALDVLPEEHDVATMVKQEDFVTPLRRKLAYSPTGSNQRGNRNGQIFTSPPATPSPVPTSVELDSDIPQSPITPTTPTTLSSSDKSVRESWSTISSASTYLEGLNIGLPTSPTGYRQSVSSMRTFMTTDSAEAVCPRPPPPLPPKSPNRKFLNRANPRVSVPVSLSDFDMYPDIPEDDDFSSLYDAFPRPASYVTDRPETLTAPFTLQHIGISESGPDVPPSPTTSVSTGFSAFTTFSSSSDSNQLSIKAAYKDSIIMLRASRDLTLTELRQRLYNKFIGQEGIPLVKEFILTIVTTQMASIIAQLGEPVVDHPELRTVSSQGDWETIAYSTDGPKLTLRILDAPA